MVPFVHPLLVGEASDRTSHGFGQLNVVYRGPAARGYVQGTYYTYTSLLGSEVVLDFPLTARGGVAACRYLLPAFSLVTFYYADESRADNGVRLGRDGELAVSYAPTVRPGAVERLFIAQMRRLGFLSHPALIKILGPGQSIHYAGTLPMGRTDLRYATEPSGRLRGTRAIYVADAASFPSLPAKNHTLTIMANAMRVAGQVAASLRQP
jgi:choline dehydrogenase-like flavoprotein